MYVAWGVAWPVRHAATHGELQGELPWQHRTLAERPGGRRVGRPGADRGRARAELEKNLEDFTVWTKKTSTEKNVAKKASNQVFTTYHELDLIK